jgi:16S rRNA (guanine527-N7)-methyltransferase
MADLVEPMPERSGTGMSGDRGGPLPHIAGATDFAAAFGVASETLARLRLYEELLRQWQRAVNLVAPSSLADVWHRHFADSAQLLPLVAGARRLVDLGSGGGFPGLVLAILLADSPSAGASVQEAHACAHGPRAPQEARSGEARLTPRVSLVETDVRTCAFLAEVVRRTHLLPRIAVDILSTRAEAAATQVSLRGADVITARALAPLHRLLGLAAPLFLPDTVGVFLKGRDAAAELEVAQTMWNFQADLLPSRTARDARIVLIRHPEAKGKASRDRRKTRG